MYQFKTNLAEFEALDCGRGGGVGKGRECVGWMPEGARVGTVLWQHHGFYVFNSVIVTKIRYIHCEMVLCVVTTTTHTHTNTHTHTHNTSFLLVVHNEG